MLADALQNIDQVGIRIDALKLAVDQQALDHAHSLSPQLGARVMLSSTLRVMN